MRLLPRVRRQQQTAQKNQQNNLSCFICDKSTTMEIQENFEITAKQRTWSFALIGIGALAFILGFIIKGLSADQHQIFSGVRSCTTVFSLCLSAMQVCSSFVRLHWQWEAGTL